MAKFLFSSAAIAAALILVGCGKPPEKSTNAAAPASQSAGRKCPDPDIRDLKDPCSPYYWQPKGSALKNAKSF